VISSIVFRKGYAVRLRGLGRGRHALGPGLNIVLGHNGSGKSTLLRALARATGCGQGGWNTSEAEPVTAEHAVEWDGQPVLYLDTQSLPDQPILDPGFFERFRQLRSDGEKRIGLLNSMIGELRRSYPLYRVRSDIRPTLLLDEPDRQLGFAAQSLFWGELVPPLLKSFQLVIASHSIFPILLRKEGRLRQDCLHVLSPGFEDECIRVLADAIDIYNEERRVAAQEADGG